MNTTTLCPQCQSQLPPGHVGTLCPACLLQLGFESRVATAEEATATYRPRFVIPTPEELASRFPQLEILERIGFGGMGVVYRARQRDLDRIVALKILRSDFEGQRNFSERFQREARALARLNHPNIVTVHDFGRQDDLYYFLMEFVDGTNLRQVEQTGELTPAQALAIVPQVCGALQYAHEQGVVHRDIKPENILVLRDGRVKIADFGLAKLTGQVDEGGLTGTYQIMGTPHYMAPEQVERPNSVDHRADIYSLGVVLYEMLTGELPLGRFPVPSRKAQIDVRLDDVVLRALEKEPERRYQHVTDVQTAVEEIRQTPAAKKSNKQPLPVDADKLKARVLGAVRLPSQALVIMGVMELLLALVMTVMVIAEGPEMLLLALWFGPAGALAIFAGLGLRHGENYYTVLLALLVSLLPISPLWLIKIPFIIMALMILFKDRAEQAFVEIPWRDSQSRQSIAGTLRNSKSKIAIMSSQSWRTVTSGTTTVAEPAKALIMHPGVWAGVSVILWSFVWSICSLISSMMLISALMYRARHVPGYGSFIPELAAIVAVVCWAAGVIVIIRHHIKWYSVRIQNRQLCPFVGPRDGLLAVTGLVFAASVLTFVSRNFQYDNPPVFGYAEQIGVAVQAEIALISLAFSGICGLSAILLGWQPVRWVTRVLLLAAGLFPVAVLAAAIEQRYPEIPSHIPLALLPVAMSVPAILWGLWGTRSVDRSTSNPTQVMDIPTATTSATTV